MGERLAAEVPLRFPLSLLYIYNTATPECGFQHMARGERLRKTLASTLALPPDLRQKVKKSFNGLNAESQTMRVRKCMVQLGNFHGSALKLPWFDFATSMVQLSEMHGSAFTPPSIDKKFLSRLPQMIEGPTQLVE